MSKRSAFTLVDLLIVMAVIAILAAIMFPVLARIGAKSNQLICVNNEKYLGLGIVQYAQDFDEIFPRCYMNWGHKVGAKPITSWRQGIYPYVKSTKLYSCPSNPNGNETAEIIDRSALEATGMFSLAPGASIPTAVFPISYAMNFHLSGALAARTNEPGMTVLICETLDKYASFGDTNWNSTRDIQGKGFAGHNGRENIAFADGHVKAYRPSATITPDNMWGYFNDERGRCSKDMNCRVPSPGALARFKLLDRMYPIKAVAVPKP